MLSILANNPECDLSFVKMKKRNRMNKVLKSLFCIALCLYSLNLQAQFGQSEIKRDSLDRPVYQVQSVARGYDDYIMLRWILPDYVSWMTVNNYGYRIERLNYHDGMTDRVVIAEQLKPYTEEQFAKHFSTKDSLAMAAASMLYGDGITLSETQATAGTSGSIMEVYEQQQQRFAFSMLLVELRPDLATAMGLAVLDRTAKPGISYQYTITPLVPEKSRIVVNPIITPTVRLGQWKPERYQTEMTDSLTILSSVILSWPTDNYQQFYFERRSVGTDGETSAWERLNRTPYIPFGNADAPELMRHYNDENVPYGTYDYRIVAVDGFGAELEPSDPHRVKVVDIMPPASPEILGFELLRGDTLMQALITFEKDSIEEDLVGYMPYYKNENFFSGAMIPLCKDTITSFDTKQILVNVTGLPTGQIYLAAFDKAGNISMSMPQTLFIADIQGPAKPTGLHSEVTENGNLTITWDPCPDPDVKFYQVFFANDTNHVFVADPEFARLDTCYTDSLALDVLQEYTYYYVMATDWSGNSSEPSDTLAIERPNPIPPSPCHLERMWEEGSQDSISMIWYGSADPDIDQYLLYRRMERPKGEEVPESDWTLVARLSPSEFKDGKVYYVDNAPVNTTRRYVYAMEAINRTGVSSGLSHQHAILHKGSNIIPVELKLQGTYRQDMRAAVLVWEMPALKVDYINSGPYICIYRRYEDDIFRFYTSVRISEKTFLDVSLPRGEAADYQLRLRLEDGRFSPLSNIVHVVNTIPALPEE